MMKMLRDKLARLGVAPAALSVPNDPRPVARPPVMIQGGRAAPELCMLPIDWTDQTPVPLRSVVQLKVDGIHALKLDDRIVSREGVPLDCTLHCLAGLKRLEQRFDEPMMFDGEYSEDGGFNATISAMRKGNGMGTFWLFDAVPMREWRTDTASQPIEARLERLAKELPHSESSFVGMLDYWIMGAHEARAKAEELWEAGYEGIVAKRARSLYRRRRSDEWLRLKRTITLDCTLMDIIQIDGLLRSLMCKGPAGDTIKVGSGWSAEEGKALVNAYSAVRRPMIEIMVNPVVGGGMRGARFIRVRHDKGAMA